MGFLSNIGGMLPAAYAGFNKGVDDVTARQQRETDAKYQEEQRGRARAMAPLEDEARTSRLKTSIEQDKTAGIKGGIERTLLQEQEKNLPQQLTDARIAQELSSVLPPFTLLHAAQHGTTLPLTERPPRATGTTWSIVNASGGNVPPQ